MGQMPITTYFESYEIMLSLFVCVVDVVNYVIKMPFSTGMEDTYQVRGQFKTGNPINHKEEDHYVICVYSYEAILNMIPIFIGLKLSDIEKQEESTWRDIPST